MKMRLIVYVFVSLFVVPVQAQQQSANIKANKPAVQDVTKAVSSNNASEPSYTTVPLDLSADKLPTNYQGQDIVAVYNQVEKAVPSKSEYESTEQYKARLNAAVMNDIYAFRVEPSRALSFLYNADSQAMKVTLETRPVRLIDDSVKYDSYHTPQMIAGITINSGRSIISSYTGQNAYGATREVTKSVGADYGIAIEKLPETMTGNSALASIGMADIQLSFAIAPERAKEIKTKLGVLFICKLKSPFRIQFDRSVSSPTFSDPVDALTMHNTLYTALQGVWIYNIESGEIVAKLPVSK